MLKQGTTLHVNSIHICSCTNNQDMYKIYQRKNINFLKVPEICLKWQNREDDFDLRSSKMKRGQRLQAGFNRVILCAMAVVQNYAREKTKGFLQSR